MREKVTVGKREKRTVGKRGGALLFAALVLALLLTLSACTTTANKIAVEAAEKWDEAAFVAELQRYDAADKAFELAKDGNSALKIVLPAELKPTQDPSGEGYIPTVDKDEGYIDRYENLEQDAKYMQNVLRKMIGNSSAFEIVDGEGAYPAIVLGKLPASATTDGIEADGYKIVFDGDSIYMCGSPEYDELNDKYVASNALLATSNAIYSFLEDELGCMFVREDPQYDYIPSAPTIYLAAEDKLDNPDFAWRRMYQYEVTQLENGWSRRIKSNGTGEKITFDVPGEEMSNDGNATWGSWCHTSFNFVSPDEYFDSHPEYFSYIAGARRIEYMGYPGQLCMTNPDVYKLIEARMEQLINDYPDIKYWDFSCMDSKQHCACSECVKANRYYGSPSGPLIVILNKLAKKWPNKIFSTLAYYDYSKAPKNIECEPNVNVVLAIIKTSQMYSVKYGDYSAGGAKAMIDDWSRICDRLTIWDYVVDFKHLLMPYPNLAVQKENLEYYKQHNVKAVFHQGSREQENEMARLRSYVLSKQLWDINTDVNELVSKYLTVTMGDAAPYIMKYIDKLHAELKSASNLDLYQEVSYHKNDYLTKKNMRTYLDLINDAKAAVKGDPREEEIVYLAEEFEVGVQYAIMMQDQTSAKEKEAAFERFKQLASSHNILRTSEAKDKYAMDAFIAVTYPRRQAARKAIAAIMALTLVASICGAAVAGIWYKRMKGAKNADGE